MHCHVTDLLDLRDHEARHVLQRLYRLSRLNFDDDTEYSNVVIPKKTLYLHAHLQHIIGIVIAQKVDVDILYRSSLAEQRDKRQPKPRYEPVSNASPKKSIELSASLKNGFVHRMSGTTTLVDRTMTTRIKKGSIRYAPKKTSATINYTLFKPDVPFSSGDRVMYKDKEAMVQSYSYVTDTYSLMNVTDFVVVGDVLSDQIRKPTRLTSNTKPKLKNDSTLHVVTVERNRKKQFYFMVKNANNTSFEFQCTIRNFDTGKNSQCDLKIKDIQSLTVSTLCEIISGVSGSLLDKTILPGWMVVADKDGKALIDDDLRDKPNIIVYCAVNIRNGYMYFYDRARVMAPQECGAHTEWAYVANLFDKSTLAETIPCLILARSNYVNADYTLSLKYDTMPVQIDDKLMYNGVYVLKSDESNPPETQDVEPYDNQLWVRQEIPAVRNKTWYSHQLGRDKDSPQWLEIETDRNVTNSFFKYWYAPHPKIKTAGYMFEVARNSALLYEWWDASGMLSGAAIAFDTLSSPALQNVLPDDDRKESGVRVLWMCGKPKTRLTPENDLAHKTLSTQEHAFGQQIIEGLRRFTRSRVIYNKDVYDISKGAMPLLHFDNLNAVREWIKKSEKSELAKTPHEAAAYIVSAGAFDAQTKAKVLALVQSSTTDPLQTIQDALNFRVIKLAPISKAPNHDFVVYDGKCLIKMNGHVFASQRSRHLVCSSIPPSLIVKWWG